LAKLAAIKVLVMLILLTLGGMPLAAAPRINLIPCGPVPEATLSALKDGLVKAFGAEVLLVGEGPIPADAYAPRRRQYKAEAFLPLIQNSRRSPQDLVLGVTGADLYVSGLNFVFGLANSRDKTAIISLARLSPEFYGLPGDPQLLEERALKEAVHELGHLLGLGHCENPHCIMFFSNTLADTDRKGPDFCPLCRRRLGRR
jgi:archaemetzincin